MQAVIKRGTRLVVDTVPDPVPETGQVLVRSLACGICGSDLHALKRLDEMAEMAKKSGFPDLPGPRIDPQQDMIFGHEFCAEVLDYGPGTARKLAPGSRVCAVPVVPATGETVGYSSTYPGGYGELMVLDETLLLEVPNGLPTEHAALTEPFAVGVHAVNKVAPTADDAFVVIGCGPIGLSVLAALKSGGFGPVIAADFSPARRKLAETLGADELVDPGRVSPYSRWQELGVPRNGAEALTLELAGRTPRRPVIFECVGVPGVIQTIMEGAPVGARIVIVGVCMEKDRFEPFLAINKQLDLHFVLAYTPEEFAETLRRIAEGELLAHPTITGHVGLDGVAGAFEALANPEQHCKILVHPWGC